MAIVIAGMPCRICDKPLEEGQEIVGFPAFISNELDPLWLFNDAAFHADCFRNHPLAGQAEARYEETKGGWTRLCAVCGIMITEPDDHFAMGELTADVNHPLHQYNYIQVHRSHLPQWPPLSVVHEQLVELRKSGRWRGGTLDWWIAELEQALSEAPAGTG